MTGREARTLLPWSEQRLGDVLAAIGNHEAKALVFLAMQEHVEYGTTAIYRRFLEIQGTPPAFTGQVTLGQKYLVHSFAPVGLVVRPSRAGGFLTHIKCDPDGRAGALAGFLLGHTEGRAGALSQIFGKTASNALGPADERPPIRRLRLLRALNEPGADLHTAALAERAGIREMPAGQALTAFAAAGLLDYRSGPTYDQHTAYRITAPLVFERTGNSVMRDAVAAHVNARLSHECPLLISRNELEAYLGALDARWQQHGSLRDQVQKVMKKMVNAGLVEAVSAHYGPTHSHIDFTRGQRVFLATLVDQVDAIAAGDPTAIAAACAAGRAILDDPDRVRALIRRAFAASKLASNPLSEAVKAHNVRAAVAQHPGSTSIELLQLLGSAYNKALLANTIAALVRDGELRGEKQPDGPYKRWYPVEH